MSSSYPGGLDSFTTKVDNVDKYMAAHINDVQDAVVAIETELGTDPAGSLTDVKSRLAVRMADDGKLKQPQQVVTVAKARGDYTTIQGAIDSIGDAADNKRYTVLVQPGIYVENVSPKNWVDLVGVDRFVTKIAPASGAAIAISSDINVNITELWVGGGAEEDEVVMISNGTITFRHCILHGSANVWIMALSGGVVEVLWSRIEGTYSPGVELIGGDPLFCGCDISCSYDAVEIYHGSPEIRYCKVAAGGNSRAINLANADANPNIHHCTITKSGSAVNTITATNAGTDAKIYLCGLNAAIEGDVNNLIAAPNNVVDADVS